VFTKIISVGLADHLDQDICSLDGLEGKMEVVKNDGTIITNSPVTEK